MATFRIVERGTEKWDYVYLIEADTAEEAEARVQQGEGKHIASFYVGQGDLGETQVLPERTKSWDAPAKQPGAICHEQ